MCKEQIKIYEFMDMHSGGSRKLEHEYIYVYAYSEGLAMALFEEKTGRDPENVTCSCCGEDYCVYEVTEDEIKNDSLILKLGE